MEGSPRLSPSAQRLLRQAEARRAKLPTEPMSLRELLNASIASFDKDPPDSDHQEGYLAALLELRRSARPEAN